MKNLRGRPRNISESGIVYLDSDGEDSEYSDSDVEPVFFPAAEFELGEALEEFAGGDIEGGVDDDDEDENDNNANQGHRFFQLIHALDSDDDSSVDGDIPPIEQEVHRSVIQYFGGTVQVRHIVHENFAQYQQQQQQQQPQSNNVIEGPSSSRRALPPLGGEGANTEASEEQHNSQAQSSSTVEERENPSEESNGGGEPSSICDSGIVIRLVDFQGDSVSVANSSMTDHSSEPLRDVGRVQETPEDGILRSEVQATVIESSVEKEDSANTSSNSSGLVPYPDLPDYASCGEEDEEDDCLKASIPAPYKSPTESYSGGGEEDESSPTNTRLSLKRKEPDKEADEEEDDEERNNPDKPSRKRIMDNNEKLNTTEEDDEEETCNPMVSDEESQDTEEAFRGDRIGSTVYSERHVLRILMRWIEELPQHSISCLLKARESEETDEDIEKRIQRLDTEFEEQMSLLWDMSSETDVMNFLVENKIFSFISDTIDRSACNRLTEIALGILANVISEPGIIEDFTVHDSSIQLVEKIVDLCTKVSDVAVLIQVFSVLRRIVWYLRNVAQVKKWTDLLQSSNFLGCSNFIMSSSRNALLLGNVIILFFTLLDFLNPENDDDAESLDGDAGDIENVDGGKEEEDPKGQSSTNSISISKRQKLATKYEPFCESEFVPSICEALKELMKNPKPSSIQKKLSSFREKAGGEPGSSTASGSQTDEHCPTADEIDIPIPEGHVQQAILKGFSTLALLQKASNGQDALKRNAKQIVSILLDFYRIFVVCTEAVTRSVSLEYFALSLHLLSFCHINLESLSRQAITTPISTASKLMILEEKDKETDMIIRVQLKDGVEFDSVSYIALVAHEYLAAVAEKFGPEPTLEARNSTSNEKFFAVLDKVVAKFSEETDTQKRSNNGFQNDTVTA